MQFPVFAHSDQPFINTQTRTWENALPFLLRLSHMDQFPTGLSLRGPTCLCPCPLHPTSHLFVRVRKPGRGILGSQSKDGVSAGEQHFSLWHGAVTQWYLGRWGGSDPERARSETENSRSKRTTWQQQCSLCSGRREQPE